MPAGDPFRFRHSRRGRRAPGTKRWRAPRRAQLLTYHVSERSQPVTPPLYRCGRRGSQVRRIPQSPQRVSDRTRISTGTEAMCLIRTPENWSCLSEQIWSLFIQAQVGDLVVASRGLMLPFQGLSVEAVQGREGRLINCRGAPAPASGASLSRQSPSPNAGKVKHGRRKVSSDTTLGHRPSAGKVKDQHGGSSKREA